MTRGLDRTVRITNPDKVFFPDDGYTKGDLIQYYASIAPVLLPHLARRALSMSRYPDGTSGGMFYEKQAPVHTPEWVVTAPIHSTQRVSRSTSSPPPTPPRWCGWPIWPASRCTRG